jgi:hypothetical protein
MKNKYIVSILFLELIILAFLYLFMQNPCGSSCDNHSIINPFGFGEIEQCISVCVQTQHPLFYIISDLLVLTLLLLLILKINERRGK